MVVFPATLTAVYILKNGKAEKKKLHVSSTLYEYLLLYISALTK